MLTPLIIFVFLFSREESHALTSSHHRFSSQFAFTSTLGHRTTIPPTRQLSTTNSPIDTTFGAKLSHSRRSRAVSSPTALGNGVIIDVGDNFFTAAFFGIGLFYALGKAYNRYLLEEVAFEQRKLEARERRLEDDPTATELDLRREESEGWTSVYGPDARRRKRGRSASDRGDEREAQYGKSRVAVQDREDEEDNEFAITDEEISTFEAKYGVEYDPYYDEAYEESELPVGKYKEDKSYGDRRYENGEVFYKEESTGLFYRQGARPRQKKFWDLTS